MKSFLLIFLSSFYCFTVLAQENITLNVKYTDEGAVMYATNEEPCAVSVKLAFKLTNLKTLTKKEVFLLEPGIQQQPILSFKVVNIKKKYGIAYNYVTAYGDATLQSYDEQFAYDLPFATGKTSKIDQGYQGRFSHQNENALDFALPEGSTIVAARAGIVIEVIDEHKKSCPRPECAQYNNNILIIHEDGTLSAYSHIQHKGALVKKGKRVKQGQKIAYSGNTGYSSGPHLHFACFLPRFERYKSIKTLFKVDAGMQKIYLEEGETYRKDY